jgi:hypothetical protein
MKLKTLMIIGAIVSLVFGLTFVIVPVQFYSAYGVIADEHLIYMARLLGSYSIGIAVLTWMARNATESDARRAIVLALFIANAFGFVVTLIGQIGNVANALGWSSVCIYFLFTLGFGYFQFFKTVPPQT